MAGVVAGLGASLSGCSPAATPPITTSSADTVRGSWTLCSPHAKGPATVGAPLPAELRSTGGTVTGVSLRDNQGLTVRRSWIVPIRDRALVASNVDPEKLAGVEWDRAQTIPGATVPAGSKDLRVLMVVGAQGQGRAAGIDVTYTSGGESHVAEIPARILVTKEACPPPAS